MMAPEETPTYIDAGSKLPKRKTIFSSDISKYCDSSCQTTGDNTVWARVKTRKCCQATQTLTAVSRRTQVLFNPQEQVVVTGGDGTIGATGGDGQRHNQDAGALRIQRIWRGVFHRGVVARRLKFLQAAQEVRLQCRSDAPNS